MSLLNCYQIQARAEAGMLENWKPELLNSSSLDLRLGRFILVETLPPSTRTSGITPVISLAQKERLHMETVDLEQVGHFHLRPGQFILAETIEKFHLPNDISAEYKLKSSMARIGLEHLNAGWCDAGWHGSVLTLEFRNMTTFHEIELVYGDKIGQVVFFQHEPVEHDDSYAAKGRYNGLNTVSAPIVDKP
jgi:dCTP deaminase